MKETMKKVLFTVVAVMLFSLGTAAQGVQVGYISSSINGANSSAGDLSGFQVGVNYELTIQGPVSVQYALLYSYQAGSDNVLGVKYKTQAHSVDLPVRLAATFPVTPSVKLFGFAGPNFSYGIANNTKYTLLGVSKNEDLYDNSDISRFNLQLGIGAGVKFNDFTFKLGYDWGLLDLNKSKSDDLKVNAFTASVGYSF